MFLSGIIRPLHIFQLLDRDSEGKSSYKVHLSELAMTALAQEMGLSGSCDAQSSNTDDIVRVAFEKICKEGAYIPKNLSIIATMNTSDESVYFMDSAFKRRWQFEYIDANNGANKEANKEQVCACVKYKADSDECEITWDCLRQSINLFMITNAKTIRGIEDKQIGLWFVKATETDISEADITFKLMHYLWDNVFARDKKPLRELLDKSETELATFGQFVMLKDAFIREVLEEYPSEKPACKESEQMSLGG